MDYSYYIVDDDLSIRTIIIDIIKNYELGNTIGSRGEGSRALKEIPDLKPDIVIIDFLLPDVDGIELISLLKSKGYQGAFIMISQVSDKEMIAKAYNVGVEFFITKPINVVEVVNVIDRTLDNLSMKRTLTMINQSIDHINRKMQHHSPTQPSDEIKIKRVLGDLGVLGEAGALDIISGAMIIKDKIHNYKLKDVYDELSIKRLGSNIDVTSASKATEQRIRRTISYALQNLAHIGLEDYLDDRFTSYSNYLFDFSEVKLEMNYIKKKTGEKGKINVKKFLEGIVLLSDVKNSN